MFIISTLVATLAVAPGSSLGSQRIVIRDGSTQKLTYSQAVMQFGVRFMKLAAKEGTGNLFVSPLSAHLALSMLANGVDGEGQGQMQGMLGMSMDDLNRESSSMIRRSFSDGGMVLSLSNAALGVNETRLTPGFCNTVRSAYNAEVGTVSSANGADIINAWIKKSTRGRIDQVLKPLTSFDYFVLINTLAFDGKWVNAFSESATKETDFGSGESKSKVKMMNLAGQVPCATWGRRPAIALPYQGNFNLIAILPSEGETPEQVIQNLTPEVWSSFGNLFVNQLAMVSLPRFKIASDFRFEHWLGALGAPALINGSADFSPLCNSPQLKISQALQKVFIDVDEKGTKAAAATVIVGSGFGGGSPQPKYFVFNANRPFVVILVERSSMVPLLLGIVNDPSK